MSSFDNQLHKVRTQDGFIAALDQSGGSTPKALRLYGVEESEYSGDDEMFAKVDADGNGEIDYAEFVVATMNEKNLLSNNKL